MTEYVRPPEQQRARLIENPTVWNRFVDTTVSGLPMHHLDFLSLLASNAGRQLIPLGITHGAEIVAVTPLFVGGRGPAGIIKTINNVGFYDGLVPQTTQENVLPLLNQIKDEAKKRHIGFTTFSVFPDHPFDASQLHQLQSQGYSVTEHPSFVIPLRGREGMSARRFANRRIYRNLQRARENNVIVRNATEREMDEEFPHLEKVAYEATGGTFPFSDRLFGDIWRQFHTDPRFIMRSAYVVDPWSGKDQVIGMGLMITNGRIANFWKLATRSGYEYVQPSTALYWDMIKRGIAKKLQAIDTGGAPSAGIRDYKLQWGAVEVPYYYIRSVNSPWYQPIESVRRVYRHVQMRRTSHER